MKMTIKVTLMFVLFVSTTFADGQMGSGGCNDCPPPPPPPCTENCGRPEGDLAIASVKGGKPTFTVEVFRSLSKFYFGF